MHPLTTRLAQAMYAADGTPTRDAHGHPVSVERYEGWADSALQALADMAPGLRRPLANLAAGRADEFDHPDQTVADELEQRLHRAMPDPNVLGQAH